MAGARCGTAARQSGHQRRHRPVTVQSSRAGPPRSFKVSFRARRRRSISAASRGTTSTRGLRSTAPSRSTTVKGSPSPSRYFSRRDAGRVSVPRPRTWIVVVVILEISISGFLDPGAGPGVVHVRTQDVLPEGTRADVVQVLRQHGAALEQGALVSLYEPTGECVGFPSGEADRDRRAWTAWRPIFCRSAAGFDRPFLMYLRRIVPAISARRGLTRLVFARHADRIQRSQL